MKIGTGLLDKMVNGAFLNKRKMGRPLKYNIRTRGRSAGFIELVFNPRNGFEMGVSQFIRFMHPYLAFVTYRFHVEKAREAGIRIEDFYVNKFHKEPYYMNHLYAQYFHPHNLLERVRDVSFYRRPRTIFKGFKVPDWATADKTSGWQVDAYSRTAWDNAMHDFHSEATPMPFAGDRQEPNPLQWFRFEQIGKGNSTRLFFNEVPEPWWHRNQGHFDASQRDELLYSFTNGDQVQQIDFGMDTTTEEGRIAFKAEFDAIADMCPEMVQREMMIFPHEMVKPVSTEPHFQRVWTMYRLKTLNDQVDQAVEEGNVTQEDADKVSFLWTGKSGSTVALNKYTLANLGLIDKTPFLDTYEAAERVFKGIGFEHDFSEAQLTAESLDSQFWGQFDEVYGLNEIEMREQMPLLIMSPQEKHLFEAKAYIADQLIEEQEAEQAKVLPDASQPKKLEI